MVKRGRKLNSVLAITTLAMTFGAQAEEYPANHCEIFVDKTLVNHAYHGAFGYASSLNTYVKIDLEQINAYHGGVSSVYFEGTKYLKDQQNKVVEVQPVKIELKPFFSEDYWTTNIGRLDSVHWSSGTFKAWEYQVLQGTFKVDTNSGTTLKVVSGTDETFSIDFRLLESIDKEGQWTGRRRSGPGPYYENKNVADLKKTTDYQNQQLATYLNPDFCR